MSEDVTSAYGSEDASRGRADVSEPGNESQNVTDFSEAAARRPAYGRLPVVGVAARAVPEKGDMWVAETADRCATSGLNQTAGPEPPDPGSRSIAHIGGDDPAWRTSITLNP